MIAALACGHHHMALDSSVACRSMQGLETGEPEAHPEQQGGLQPRAPSFSREAAVALTQLLAELNTIWMASMSCAGSAREWRVLVTYLFSNIVISSEHVQRYLCPLLQPARRTCLNACRWHLKPWSRTARYVHGLTEP